LEYTWEHRLWGGSNKDSSLRLETKQGKDKGKHRKRTESLQYPPTRVRMPDKPRTTLAENSRVQLSQDIQIIESIAGQGEKEVSLPLPGIPQLMAKTHELVCPVIADIELSATGNSVRAHSLQFANDLVKGHMMVPVWDIVVEQGKEGFDHIELVGHADGEGVEVFRLLLDQCGSPGGR
jgi:hypothetical protein